MTAHNALTRAVAAPPAGRRCDGALYQAALLEADIDREGIIRLAYIEVGERMEDLLQFPSDEVILRAARSLLATTCVT